MRLVKRVLDRNRWVSCNESDIVSDKQFSFSLIHFFYYVFVLQQGHGLDSVSPSTETLSPPAI